MIAGADASTSSALQARLDALTQELSQEQQNNAALQVQLNERGQEVDQLRAEVHDLREHSTESHPGSEGGDAGTSDVGEASSAAAPRGAGGEVDGSAFAAAEPATRDDSDPADKAPPGVLIASLRQALSEEQQRRQAAETQLERLKEETSTLPYGDPYGDNSPLSVDLAAAKQEIVELRRVLDDERAARARLTNDLIALQLRVDRESAAAAEHSAGNPEIQARLEKLEAERQTAMDTFNRKLAASEQRTAELEAELTAARATTSTGDANAATSEMASIQAQNAALRTRLDEEHRRTEELANKLKLATRVTDLIFKMQAQQAAQPQAR